jgi:hypothetical protein
MILLPSLLELATAPGAQGKVRKKLNHHDFFY